VIWPLSPSCVEGALARVSGVDREDNPYDLTTARERHRTWRWAWLYADTLLAINVDHLAATWNYDEDGAA
jgi:hypothetical protein